MRRTIVAGLALALTLGAASVSSAQQAKRGDREMRRDGMGMMFKGIELTDAQKAQLKAVRAKHGMGEAMKEQMKTQHEAMKALRESGDTAALRAMRLQMREQMKQRHEDMQKHHGAMISDVRGILTPAQQEIFDKNVTAAKERMKERMKDGSRDGVKRGKRAERHS